MRTIQFLAVVLVSGALAGLVYGCTNLVIVEPYIDAAIEIENQRLFASGVAEDTPMFWVEYESYRAWQKGGQILASVVLGLSMGSLLGIVFALSRHALPVRGDVRKALLLAGIMWLVLYMVPFLKYPGNPPAVGDPDTIVLRMLLHASFVAVSGLSLVGFYKLAGRFGGRRKALLLACYAAFMAGLFVAMPQVPDDPSVPAALLLEFRIASALGVSVFWAASGLILGALWGRYMPSRRTAPTNSNSLESE